MNDRAGVDMVCFTAGGSWPIMIERRYIARMEGYVDRQDNAIHSADCPVLTIEQLLGFSSDQMLQKSRLLWLKNDEILNMGLIVSEPVELKKVIGETILPLPEILAARCRLPGLQAIALMDDTLSLILSPFLSRV